MGARTSRRVIAAGAAGVALAGAAFLVPQAAGGTAPDPPVAPTATSTATSVARAAPAAADPRAWIVETTCTAAVLDTPSGSWLLTAAHCDVPESIEAAGRTWSVVDRVTTRWDLTAGAATQDLALLQVDGDLEAAVGGGFTVGTAPADGSPVSIWGYPTDDNRLTGCDRLPVIVESGGLAVDSCDLPDGTSGSPWYTADGVLHGITGGPDDGGTSDWDSESPRFTDETTAWVGSVVG